MSSIPELATQLVDNAPLGDTNCTTLIIMGSKSAGKSSLLQSFLEKTESPKETLVLEYSYARKSNQKQGVLEKSICHVWEYGGNLHMIKSVLSSIPMKGRITFCIIVDLSKIKTIWGTLEICFTAIEATSGNNIEVILFGGKYDIFKNYDNDTKKLINTTLRSMALLKNCHLFYYSSKEQPLLRRAKEILNGIAFGNGFPLKDKVSGLGKPLFIPKGSDSWGSIGVNDCSQSQVKTRHLAVVPLELEAGIMNPTFSTSAPSTHFEHQLDTIFNANYDEIRNIASYDVNLADCL